MAKKKKKRQSSAYSTPISEYRKRTSSNKSSSKKKSTSAKDTAKKQTTTSKNSRLLDVAPYKKRESSTYNTSKPISEYRKTTPTKSTSAKKTAQKQTTTSKNSRVQDVAPYRQRETSTYTTPRSDYNKRDKVANSTSALSRSKNSRVQDIAPVKTTTQKKKDDRTWFKKPKAFEDGYQFGDVTKTILGSATDVVENLASGVMGMGEKIVDATAYLAPGAYLANQTRMDMSTPDFKLYNEMQSEMDKFIKKDLYNEQAIARKIISDPIKKTGFDPLSQSVFGEKSDSLVQSAGQLGATVGLQALGVPWFATTGVTSFGGEVENAMKQGATYGEAGGSALISAGAEILSEKLSGGISFGGKTMDDVLVKNLTTRISDKTIRSLTKAGIDAVGEGSEEVISSVFSNLGSALYKEENIDELLTSEEAMDEYIESFIGGAVLGGGSSVVNATKSNAQGKDFATGLSNNELKVAQREIADRIKEREADGRKVTTKEKNAITQQVYKDLEKGYISIDTIESTLGGETYKKYKDSVDNETKMQEEYDELNKMKLGEMTGEQVDRKTELKTKLDELKENSNTSQMREQLDNEMLSLTANDKLLQESYNERSRRGQTFEADLNKYDAKQQEIIKRATESGILNNTNRTHEFVDMVAKISADKGVLFDFTNNEKLKESGFAMDGKTINGYVKDGNIAVNINSNKALNTIVGHEITHVLEGTELYTELQNAVKEYATTKGEYQARYDAFKNLYKDVDGAVIDNEVTADLVGDYLFTDADFVSRLSVEKPNVFKKIYDEIKYFVKSVTSGKEARELEKVKRAFDKAYKESAKASKDTKYSVSDKNIKDVMNDYASGESYFTMSYTQDGKTVATLKYSEYAGEPNVKMIEVEPEYRRKGIGTKLLQELQRKYPDTEISFGMSTPDGTKLLESATYTVENKDVTDKFARIQEIQKVLDKYDEGYNNFFENDIEIPDDYAEDYNDLYDEKVALQQELRGKKKTKTFVKTDTKFSLSEDSEGNKLSDAQKEYFKDSKVLDDEGKLKVVYHGSPADFNEFSLKYLGTNGTNEGYGFYFTDQKHIAQSYANGTEAQRHQGANGKLFEVYLDIKKPLSDTEVTMTRSEFKKFLTEMDKQVDEDGEPLEFLSNYGDVSWEGLNNVINRVMRAEYDGSDSDVNIIHSIINGCGNMEVVFDVLRKTTGYDGIIVEEAEWGGDQKIYVVFHPEQIKNIDNQNPTDNPDVRYSLSEDSDGKKLSKEQQDYFKDSKVRDDNGNLKVMYHGTEKGGFHEFMPDFSDDGQSFFFVDNNEVAKSYSGTHENYTAQTLKTAEDFNKFFESVDADEYEVREENGQFVLYEDGDEVATSDTADGIYEEFRDWTGLGTGSANYKVYLNLKNPLTIDAENNNWDDLDRVSKGNKKVYNTLSAKVLSDGMFEYRYWNEKDKQISGKMSEQEFEKTFGSKFFEEVVENDSEFNTVGERLIIDTDTGKEVPSTTREYSQYAKENGYDGVIFKNIIDNGLFASGMERFTSSTVAIAFDSNQIKSVDNTKPTLDPDIRYSLSDDDYAPFQGEYAPLTEAEANERDAMQNGRLQSLNENDMPQEVDAPYYGETPIDDVRPFDDRDIKDVGKKNVKAYMYENPEVKPFFQDEAQIMLRELRDSVKGERTFNDQLYYDTGGENGWFATKRQTSDEIAYLLDEFKYTYADIEKGLKAIIEDHGAENNAISKRIEFMIDERLREGYTDFTSGYDIPNNPDYIALLEHKQITEYNDEAYNRWVESLANVDFVESNKMADDIAPVRSDAIKPRPVELEGEEAQMAKNPIVRADSTESKPRDKQRKWVKTSTESEVVNKKIVPEDLDQSAINYQPIPNKKTLGKANSRLDSMGYDSSLAYFKSQFERRDVKLEDVALGERLIQEAMKKEDYDTARELIQDVSILGTELGQKVQALSIIQRLTPEGQLRNIRRVIERGTTRGDKAFEGVKLTPEMEEKILKARKKDGTFDQKELNKAVEDVKQELANQMKVTMTDKVNAWRYLSMLGNPKTHIRNMVSNIAMKGTLSVKNAVARSIEGIAPVKGRTKTWESATDEVKAFAHETMKELYMDIYNGEEGYQRKLPLKEMGGKYNDATDIKSKRAVFKNKILNGLYEFNSDMLAKEDWWFSKSAFEKSFREFLTANGIKTKEDIQNNLQLVEKGKRYATEQAQIATFQQYSWLANKIGDIERKNALTNMAVGAVVPFKKTPINIAKTGLNYSPLGFAKTLTYDISEVKKGNMEASTLVDHLAQNVTGSALTLVGYMLAQSGFLNGSGDDDKEGTYDYQLGKQSYSINIGDGTYSLSWLTPVAMPLFVGANAYGQLVEGQEWNGDVVVETLAQTLDPLSEMSFLSSLDSVLSSYDSGIKKFAGIGETMIQNYATQFIPTLSSQVASTMDDKKRSTKVSGDSGFKMFEETLNKLKYKIPGLRETLEPTIDIWGNDVKQNENLFGRAMENFIAPYSRKASIATSIDEELKDVYAETGEDELLPTIPYNYLNYNGEKYKMSAKEYTEYKQMYGQTANDMLYELFHTTTYQISSPEEKTDMIERVYDYARDEANRDYLSKEGVDYTNATKDGKEYYREDAITTVIADDIPLDEATFKVNNPEKYDFFKQYDITYREYKNSKENEDTAKMYDWAYQNPEYFQVARAISNDLATYWKHNGYMWDNIRADKDANGNSIPGTKKEKIIEYINGIESMSYEEKLVLFKKYYPADDSYNNEIIDYLNSRDDISYEEMVMILEELDFEVDEDGYIYW